VPAAILAIISLELGPYAAIAGRALASRPKAFLLLVIEQFGLRGLFRVAGCGMLRSQAVACYGRRLPNRCRLPGIIRQTLIRFLGVTMLPANDFWF
jgi:hypothetical protein